MYPDEHSGLWKTAEDVDKYSIQGNKIPVVKGENRTFLGEGKKSGQIEFIVMITFERKHTCYFNRRVCL